MAGVKVTEIEQPVPGASVLLQLLVSAKSAGFAPATEMVEIVKGAVPGFDREMNCTALTAPTVVLWKARVEGDRIVSGVGASVPVPVSATVWGEPVTSSATLIAATKLPADGGVKVTEIVQLLPAESMLVQVVVSAKALAFVPVMVMPEMLSGAVPLLVIVTGCAVLVTPTVVPGKGFIVPRVT